MPKDKKSSGKPKEIKGEKIVKQRSYPDKKRPSSKPKKATGKATRKITGKKPLEQRPYPDKRRKK